MSPRSTPYPPAPGEEGGPPGAPPSSGDLLRQVVRESPDVLLVVDGEGRVVFAGGAVGPVLGYEPEELLGRPVEDLVPQDLRDRHREHRARFLTRPARRPMGSGLDLLARRKDGSLVPVDVMLAPLAGDGETRTLAVMRDVTDRRERDERLRRHTAALAALAQLRVEDGVNLRARLRRITEVAAEALRVERVGVWLYEDGRSRIRCLELYQRSPRRHGDGTVLHSSDCPAYFRAMEEERTITAHDARVDPRTRDLGPGYLVPLGITSMLDAPIRTQGRVVGVVCHEHVGPPRRWTVDEEAFAGSVADVVALALEADERWRAQEEIRKLSRAVEQTADCVMITDRNGVIEYVNPAWCEITGFTAEEAVGRTPRIVKSGAHDPAFYRELWETIAAGRPWRGRIVNRKKSGELYTEEKTISPLFDEDGEIRHFVSTAKDITAEQALEARLRQAQKMEAVGRLAGGIAHDFNNLLTVILSGVELLREEVEETRVSRELMAEIREAADRARSLTSQLLAFGRKQVLRPRTVDLNGIVRRMEKMLRRLIEENVVLHLELAPGPLSVRVDPAQMEQVILNLAVNARDAMPRGGELTVATWRAEVDEEGAARRPGLAPGPYVVLTVRDTGVGMDEETVSRIFEPFFTTKEVGRGTGLGLATVYGIVKQSGGWIGVASEPGTGTTFEIYLPPAEGEPELEPPPEAAGEAPGGTPGGTLLLVEDDDTVRRLGRRILERAGYQVLVAATGEEALELLRRPEAAVDLLITDVVLPGMSGDELARTAGSLRPALPVLYVSGYAGPEAGARQGVREGIPVLGKPFTPDTLLAAVRELLEER